MATFILREFCVRAVVVMMVAAMSAAVLYGCTTSYYSGKGVLRSFKLVKPLMSDTPVYEDKDIRVGFRIIDDKRIELDVKNLTRQRARIFWKNSSFAAIDNNEAELGIDFLEIDGQINPTVSTIESRDTLTVEVFPAHGAFVNDEGKPDNRPLYMNADGEGGPEDIVGKDIGLNIVFELNGSSRFHRFRMSVMPSPPEAG
jgi:hypothetical protein